MSSKPASVENGATFPNSGSSESLDTAPIAGAVADKWLAATAERTVTIPEVKAYNPGRFFERELPVSCRGWRW